MKPLALVGMFCCLASLSTELAIAAERAEIVAWGADFHGQTDPGSWSNVIAVAAGRAHTVALTGAGQVLGWGAYDAGTGIFPFSVPSNLTDVIIIAAGGSHTLAVTSDGSVVSWGYNAFGQTNVPAGLTNVAGVAAGDNHSLAITPGGQVIGWGANFAGQSTPPAGLSNVIAVAGGEAHSIALTASGRVVDWGGYFTVGAFQTVPVPADASNVIAIAAGYSHSLALRADGRVIAWGKNDFGQISVPPYLTNAEAIAAGAAFSAALTADGRIVSWGSYAGTNVPPGLNNVISLAAGFGHGFALLLSTNEDDVPKIISTPRALGALNYEFSYRIITKKSATSYGASGLPPGLMVNSLSGVIRGVPSDTGTFNSTLFATNSAGVGTLNVSFFITPPSVPVISSTGIVVFGRGLTSQYQVVALNAAEGFRATGLPLGVSIDPTMGRISGLPIQEGDFPFSVVASNRYGATTNSLLMRVSSVLAWDLDVSAPIPPASLRDVVGISAGYNHNIALTSSGRVVAWGYGSAGPTNVPVGLTNVIGLSAGGFHSLALKADGHVAIWGNGQSSVPNNWTNIVAVAGGGFHSLALASDGRVLGFGASVPNYLSNVVAIAAAYTHSLALTADGKIVAWGQYFDRNGYHYVPVTVPEGLSNVVAIAAGYAHDLALMSDGRVAAFGLNTYGQLNVPPGLSNVIEVAAGPEYSLARTADNHVVCWGYTALLTWDENARSFTNVPPNLSNVVALAAGGVNSLALLGPPPDTAAPQLLAARRLIGTADRPFYSRISAQNGTVAYGATGLPPGLTLDATSGIIHGVPLQGGTFNVTLFATNNAGVGSLDVIIFINLPLPFFVGTSPLTLALGLSMEYSVVASNATSLSAIGLPPGLTIDSASGLIHGIPTAAGEFEVELIASNGHGNVTASLPIKVSFVVEWGQAFSEEWLEARPLSNVVAVAAGDSHNLALTGFGDVIVWGDDPISQIDVPSDATNVVAISAQGWQSIALTADGRVRSWGLGVPGVPATLTNIAAVAAGGLHALAVTRDGRVRAWGDNSLGQTDVPLGLSNIIAVSAGVNHSLALDASGRVFAWGANDTGQTNTPPGLTDIIAIAAGDAHNLALTAQGEVIAWGLNAFGQTNVPSTLTDVVAIAAGSTFSAAVTTHGRVIAWGYATNVPFGLSNVISIAAGSGQAVAVVGDRSATLLRLEQLRIVGDSFQAALPTQRARTYLMERSDSLKSDQWTFIQLLAGNGQLRFVSDATQNNASRFYRVRRLPPSAN